MSLGADLRALRQDTHTAIEKINELPAATRQAVVDAQWRSIPLAVSEHAYSAALAVGQQLNAPPQTGGLEIITSVVVCISADATASGVLQLGDLFLPVYPGRNVYGPVQQLLGATDIRRLTLTAAATATQAAIWLTGQQMPTYGILAH